MEITRRIRSRRTTTSPSKSLCAVAALAAAVTIEALPLRAQETQTPQEPTAQEGRQVHVVRSGDTLWDLAEFYLNDPFLWPEIYRLNAMVVEDPHWIFPDERLQLPFPGQMAQQEPPDAAPAPVEPPEAQPAPMQEQPTIFARRELGEQRRTLVYAPGQPIPATAVTEGDFRRSGMLADIEELGPRGRVINYIAPTVVDVEQAPTVPRYGRIYVSHPNGERPAPGDQLVLFRVDRRIGSFGRVIRPTGQATVAAVHEDVSTAVVTRLYDRVLTGDQVAYAQPYDERPGVFPEPVEGGPSGELLAFLDRQPVVAVEDVAFIDVGRDQGVTIGDEFEIYLSERRTRGLRLPQEHVAVGRVVRVTDRTATLRLIRMRHPTIEPGLPVRLVRKMPT
jgi:hypothetical protein